MPESIASIRVARSRRKRHQEPSATAEVRQLRPATTAYGLVLVLGLNSQQVAEAGVSMTELADLLHSFVCEIAPDANPIATVASSTASDPSIGADDVIRCALHAAEQLTHVASRNPEAAPDRRLVVGRLELDRAAAAVIVDNKRLNLTFREYRLLEYLAEHSGRVITRHELMRSAWDRDESGQGRTVDVHIARIRSKLGNAADIIATVRGIGYRLDRADRRPVADGTSD
jgi:hypothetical protein